MFDINGRETLRAVGLYLGRDGTMSAIRTLIGVTMGALIGTGTVTGAVPLAVMGAGFVAFTGAAHWAIERGRQETLLDTYRTEVSHMLGKGEKHLTVADLKQAAKSPANPEGSTAIKMGLDYYKDTRNFFITSQAITAAIMVGALGTLGSMGNLPLPTLGLIGASGLVYNRMFRTVENIHDFVTRKDVRYDIIRDIETIQDQVALGGRVSSTRVLGVLVEANPELQTKVRAALNQPYKNLSIAKKRMAVKLLEDETQVTGLTKEINMGSILPTELAFIAFGESSGAPKEAVAPEIHIVQDEQDKQLWTAHVAVPEESYTKQLDVDAKSIVEGTRTLN